MFNLIIKHKFPEQSGLIPLLEKYHDPTSGITLSSYLEPEDKCDIGLYYGNGSEPLEYNCTILSFNHVATPLCDKIYYIDHPIRPYLDKWNYTRWNGKYIQASKIFKHSLEFKDYNTKVIVNDLLINGFLKDEMRLKILSKEREIPVLSYTNILNNAWQNNVQKKYSELRDPKKYLSHDSFMNQLINIVGRLNATKR